MKEKTFFVCQNCGYQSLKWLGKCPQCSEWNTMLEERIEEEEEKRGFVSASKPIPFTEIKKEEEERINTGLKEFDRVLGGGTVKGSLVLIGGEPGIGKSTLLLQIGNFFAGKGKKVLYVSGEESLSQIKMRGERLGIKGDTLFLLSETNLERILEETENLKPDIFILDSIQTIFSMKFSSPPGSISQVREVANQIFYYAKSNLIPSFIIGHITKDGTLAGPKALEHIVDVVLFFEGDRNHHYRVLRVLKNRFGPVSELGVFEMRAEGLIPVPNPSSFFIEEKVENEPGSVIFCTLKGSRPLLVEIQALISSSPFVGNPRRMTVGLDHFRTSMLLAIIEKRLGYSFSGDDIYLNVAGGLTIEEPAADLAVISAIISSVKNKPLSSETIILGEVGLAGEIRSIIQLETRLKEAFSLGFKKAVVPLSNLSSTKGKSIIEGVEVYGVKNIKEAINILF
ncbi:DNA repair protein RadA [Candidatus Aminicenantes bacterium AC-335-B20]|jgi:DNA repair protein RadA/Sms|nr:DNA repair protein RadA [SCandidatus Aminicenantes bacterium Aminicenantia_JdfR_composite]MCP2596684.1 DNA repair protein RadA [Candidatus Aminicenantes bacterium AC-335-G13]MCP2598928.1 DNA repair protein RadA [Candidatus Aminicenantes bacterium AC-335-B20]